MSTFPVNVQKLREFYRGYDGIVALIDYLASPQGMKHTYFGSNTVDLDGVLTPDLTDTEAADAIFFKTYKLYIGSKDGSVTPLEWIEQFSKVFTNMSPLKREQFNRVFGDFAKIFMALQNGVFKEVTDEILETEEIIKYRQVTVH